MRARGARAKRFARRGFIMSDTAIVGRHVDVYQHNATIGGVSTFSWGAVLGGAVAATAVSFLLISLGSGIGLLAASPYASGPSWATLTAAGAIWVVLAQTWGHATGGYIAGRLRNRLGEGSADETNFRDGAHGFVAWAFGVLLTAAMVALGGMFAAGTTAHVTATVGAGAASGAGSAMQGPAGGPLDPSAYVADRLFRPDPGAPTTGQAAGAGRAPADGVADRRAEATRIFANGMRQGELDANDRAYLVQLVAQRTGTTQADAEQRVAAAEQRLRESAKEAADKAAKAASLFSFWTFMALLMGAAAATVGGVFGGNQRDENILGVR
jgi:hypothetical protein